MDCIMEMFAPHFMVAVHAAVITSILFMCKKKKPPAATANSKKEEKKSEKAKKAGSKSKKKEGSKKEDSKKEDSKKAAGSKKEGSKKEGSKKAESKKGASKKDEPKKEEEKEGAGDKEAGSKLSKVDQTSGVGDKDKKGSKLVDVDEHASDVKDKTDNEPKDGEKKEGEKKEGSKKEGTEKKDAASDQKKEEANKEEHKLLVDPKEIRFTNPDGKAEILKLNLNNTTGLRLVVKIKCSDNNLFRVNPVFSFLEKDEKCVVEVSRNAGNSKPDKLSVVYCEAPADMKDAQAVFKVVQTVAASKIKTINVNMFHDGKA